MEKRPDVELLLIVKLATETHEFEFTTIQFLPRKIMNLFIWLDFVTLINVIE